MKSKELILLISIVLFDLVTKLAANFFLPLHESIYVFADTVSLYLTHNEGSTGGQAEYLMQEESNKNMTLIMSCISGLITLFFIVFIRNKKIKTVYKILIGIGLFITLNFLMVLIDPLVSDITISSSSASIFGKLSGLILYGTIFYFSKDKWIRISIILLLACGIGNLLSHFYSPYNIIDFIYIEGSYELLRIGVSNFADLSFDIGAIGLIISFIRILFKKIVSKNQKSTSLEEA